MKKLIILLTLIGNSYFTIAQNQTKEIERKYNTFRQFIDASFLKTKTKFKLSASMKLVTEDTAAFMGLVASVTNKDGSYGFFDNMWKQKERPTEWKTFIIEGELDENSDKLSVGGIGIYNGKFFFDNFEVFVENEKGKFKKIPLGNPDFENVVEDNKIPGWINTVYKKPNQIIKGYSFHSIEDKVKGKHALLMEGKGIKRDLTSLIGPREGFTPQVGTLVSMLNNLSKRVEWTVQSLNQKEVDWLFDENANSIGALIMHLAAAETYYQVYTFENRTFNEEEKEKWGVALNLDEEARKTIKGHDVAYYLDIYKEVRKKTIEVLRTKDDQWLAEKYAGTEMNTHMSWFHVAEHQSSHLGQILMLKKRIPKELKEEDKSKIENIKLDTDK